jgi:uncharacterized protein YfdQ (DUF2303 family)
MTTEGMAVQELHEILENHGKTETVMAKRGDSDEVSLLVIRKDEGVEIIDPKKYLDQYLQAPERRKGTARVSTLDSFVALVIRYKDKNSAVFCNPAQGSPSLTAILNYNPEGSESSPRFGDHRVLYQFPLSEEWLAWKLNNGKWLKVIEFAEFMEDRVLDVIDPGQIGDAINATLKALDCSPAGPSQMMALSKGIKVKVDRSVTNVINLNSGECQVNFEESHRAGAENQVVAPGAFVIGVPVFYNGSFFQIAVRLRYRVTEGEIKWKYDLHRPDQIFDFALNESCELAKSQTDCPLFVGSPES